MFQSLILKNKEKHYSMSELARRLPVDRCGKTVNRWCTIGSKGVVMESFDGTGGRQSSIEAYYRFIAKISEAKRVK